MYNESEKYGTYFGVLVDFKDNPDLIYCDWGNTKDQMQRLYDYGVREIMFDIEDDEDYSNTLFFETDENTDFHSLMCIIANFRPHEFSEETEHHFRMWFD